MIGKKEKLARTVIPRLLSQFQPLRSSQVRVHTVMLETEVKGHWTLAAQGCKTTKAGTPDTAGIASDIGAA